MLTILLAVQMLSAISMIVLILMQHGKGADAGAAFGGGGAGSASLFGASGGANFLSRSTGVLAAVFLASTLGLAYFGNLRATVPGTGSVLEGSVLPAQSPAAAQIPDSTGGALAPAPAALPSAPTGTGAAQIPGK
jgi:preprotein translocase subunit SecG